MRFSVFAKPGSKKGPLVEKNDENELTVFIREKAVDGKANDAVIKLLASFFNVRQNDITILSGKTSRHKIIDVDL